jgi:hypothetical protein
MRPGGKTLQRGDHPVLQGHVPEQGVHLDRAVKVRGNFHVQLSHAGFHLVGNQKGCQTRASMTPFLGNTRFYLISNLGN